MNRRLSLLEASLAQTRHNITAGRRLGRYALQVGDAVWSLLPGAQALGSTRVTDVRHVEQTGYINVHTLQGAALVRRL